MKGKLKWIVIGIVGLAILGAIGGGGDDNEAPVVPDEPEEVVETAVEPAEPLTFEEEVVLFLENTVGATTNHSSDELKGKVPQVLLEEEELFVDIIASDNLTTNMIKTGILMDAEKILSSIYDEFTEMNEVTTQWYFPMVDDRGNENLRMVLLISFTRDNAATINWPNFSRDNFPRVADSYWEHPAFSG